MNREEFARAVFTKIGAEVNKTTLYFGIAWAAFEDTEALNNPWATTEPWTNSTMFNSVGVRNYQTWHDGIDATVATLLNGYYDHLVHLLKQPNITAKQLLGALTSSPWGSHPTVGLYQDVEQNVNHFNKGVPGSPVLEKKPTPVPAPAPKPTALEEWASWIAIQLAGSGYAIADCTIAVDQYLKGETVTNEALANNLWSMIFTSGTLDKRYVPPMNPVPEVKGANPALVAELAAALTANDIPTATKIESELGMNENETSAEATSPGEEVDTLESRLAAANAVTTPAPVVSTVEDETTETPAEAASEPAGDVDTLESRLAAQAASTPLA